MGLSNSLEPDQDNLHPHLFACWVILHAFLSSAVYFQNSLFQITFQEYHQDVKQCGAKSGPTFCRA